jgi:hypothetical protein
MASTTIVRRKINGGYTGKQLVALNKYQIECKTAH